MTHTATSVQHQSHSSERERVRKSERNREYKSGRNERTLTDCLTVAVLDACIGGCVQNEECNLMQVDFSQQLHYLDASSFRFALETRNK